MSIDASRQRTVAAVFDLRRSASREALRRVVGAENVPQFAAMNQPFVVLMLEGAQGEATRLAFADEGRLLDFYLATLRINAQLEPQRRVQFVLRDLDAPLVDTVREATAQLAHELAGT